MKATLRSIAAGNAWVKRRFSLAIDERIFAGLAVGLVAAVVLTIVSDRSFEKLAEKSNWVRHTYEVLAKLQRVNSGLISVHLAVSGFVITGREDDLEPYYGALREQQKDEHTLRWLTADNPRQQARLVTLEDLTHQLLAFSADIIDIQRHHGYSAAAALISNGRGKTRMAELTSIVAAMEQEELALLDSREVQASIIAKKTSFILSIYKIIDVGLLLTMLFFLNAEAGGQTESANRQAADILKTSEQRFRTMADSIVQLAWVARADGSINWYNQRWYEYTGTNFEQMKGSGWQSVHDPEMLPKVLEGWTGAISSGEPFEMEFPLRRADGTFRMFLTRVHPFKNAEGSVTQWFGTNTDVNELKRMEESLRAAQARLHSTLAAGRIGTWTWDIAGDRLAGDEFVAHIFSVNPAAAAKGLPAEMYLKAVMQEDQASVAKALANAIQSCGLYDIEYRVRQTDGALLWLQSKGRVEGDAAGQAVYFHGAVMDITERKRNESRFRRLVDSNAQGVMFWNMTGEITDSNDAFLSIVGYTREDQIAGKIDWKALTPPEFDDIERRSMEELTTRGICTPFEKEYIRKDGSRVPILLGAATFEDSPDEGVCFLLDMTERKLIDQALFESAEHFRFLNDLFEATRTLLDPQAIIAVTACMLGQHLGASRCAYVEVDCNGERFTVVHDYTDGCESTVGDYQLSTFGDKAVSTLHSGQTLTLHNVEAELLPASGGDMFSATGIQAIISCPVLKDGGLRALMAVHQTSPRQWTLGEIRLVEEVAERCQSSVERRLAEESVRVLNVNLEQRVVKRTAEADASNRAKSVFLATMSHEIRTPMNAILGYSQLMLRDRTLGADARTNLQIINRSGEHLLALINDVLDMSRIEAGRTEVNPTTFSLSELVNDIAGMFRLRAAAKALRFAVITKEEVPYIVADGGKIRQVLINLLGNAVKFTEYGYIRLTVSVSQEQPSQPWLTALIEDTGPGISNEDQKKLFQSFSHTNRSLNEGTGLGLAISRAHARLMGGDLTVASSPGVGSSFELGIPVGIGNAGVAIMQRAPRRVIGIRTGQRLPRILIVDDLVENRDWLMKLLTLIGFSVGYGDSGEAAIREWREWHPELILMDLHMPGVDGLEATRLIKAEPGGPETVIVILTASVLDEDRQKVLQSGADGFLPKPCAENALLEKVRGLLHIVYDYEEVNASSGNLPLPSGEIFPLPVELIEQLQNATSDGDKRLLDKLIASVNETENIEFARNIKNLADRYEYDALAQLLRGASLTTEQSSVHDPHMMIVDDSSANLNSS